MFKHILAAWLCVLTLTVNAITLQECIGPEMNDDATSQDLFIDVSHKQTKRTQVHTLKGRGTLHFFDGRMDAWQAKQAKPKSGWFTGWGSKSTPHPKRYGFLVRGNTFFDAQKLTLGAPHSSIHGDGIVTAYFQDHAGTSSFDHYSLYDETMSYTTQFFSTSRYTQFGGIICEFMQLNANTDESMTHRSADMIIPYQVTQDHVVQVHIQLF